MGGKHANKHKRTTGIHCDRPLLNLPVGDGPTGRWVHVAPSGHAWPGSVRKDPNTRHSPASPNPRSRSSVEALSCHLLLWFCFFGSSLD